MAEEQCRCRERWKDLTYYGIHICRDGERVDPFDFYIAPEEKEAGAPKDPRP